MSVQLKNFNTKGQVTLFIIIGVAVVIIAGLVIMFMNLKMESDFEENASNLPIEKVNVEFSPIQDYVSRCTESLATEAIKRIGLQGGYISGDGLLGDPINPTGSSANSLLFFPHDPSYKIAYWWYMDSADDCDDKDGCTFTSHRPDLENSPNSIQEQIETYVVNNIDSCLLNFETFKDTGFEFKKKGDVTSEVTFGSGDYARMVIMLNYPLEISKGSRTQDMSNFYSAVDIDFRRIYRLANGLAEGESKTKYLERQIMNLIAVFSSTSRPNSLPPMSELDFQFGLSTASRVWSQVEVRNMIKDLLSSYVPLMRVLEAGNFEIYDVEDDLTRSILEMMIVSVGESYLKYSVEFDYMAWWSPYAKVGNSEILKPSSILGETDIPLVGDIFSMIGLKDYTFAYDVSYPVLVKIYDPMAFNGQGYNFNFALESNLRNNMAINGSEINIGGSIVESMFCNPNQRDSGDITFNVRDDYGQPIPNSKISYMCGSNYCEIGVTGDSGTLVTNLPLCLGGVVSFRADGYALKQYNLSVGNDETFTINQKLEKYRTKKVEVKVYEYTKDVNGGWVFNVVPRDLKDYESVNIMFEREGALSDDPMGSVFAMIDGDDTEAELRLIPGTYTGSAQLFMNFPNSDYESIIIAEDDRKECTLLVFCSEYTLDEVVFDDIFPEGGFYLDYDHDNAWTIDAAELDSGDTITFYVIASPGSSFNNLVHEDLEEMTKIDYYSLDKKDYLIPVIS